MGAAALLAQVRRLNTSFMSLLPYNHVSASPRKIEAAPGTALERGWGHIGGFKVFRLPGR
jgi:hypothetical protein